MRWRSPGGAEATLHHLAPDGYELGSSLPTAAQDAVVRWRKLADVFSPRATLGVALLPNGADHHARQRMQREAVGMLAQAARPAVVVESTLREFSEVVVREGAARPLPVVEGELRDSYGYTWTLQGTLASRSAQKRRTAASKLASPDRVRIAEVGVPGAGPQ